jgi:outer membrane protein TolC
MRGFTAIWRRYRARLLSGIAASALLPLAPGAFAAEAEQNNTTTPAATAPAAEVRVFDLYACRQIALERQPAVAAARAGLEAATARSQAVDNLRVPTCLVRDLPIRRKQAALGVVIAEAGVTRAAGDTVYGVTFSYISAVYAGAQRQVAQDAIEALNDVKDFVDAGVQSGAKGVTREDQEKVAIRLLRARARLEETTQGEQRALSALREAMGLGPDCPVAPADARLLDADPEVDLPTVIALALARRGEMIQAANAAQVTGYEVDAQASRLLSPTVRTFAANSDIHGQPVPAGMYEDNYRPGAVPPEMPTQISGSRSARVEQAQAYSARAGAVADKTRGLITLEAEQAYYRWREAAAREERYRDAATRAEKQARDVRQSMRRGLPRGSVDTVLSFQQLATEMRVEANLARYQKLLALAALERVTAGGFQPGYTPAPAPPEGAQKNNDGKNNNGK